MGRSSAKIIAISERVVDAKTALYEALDLLQPNSKKAPAKFADEVFHNGVLVATYIQPAKSKGGIIIPDKTRDEDIYQGSVGLVIAMGPAAFKDDRIAQFHGVELKVGDWVLYRPSDGLAMEYAEVPCRLFQDVNILMRVSNPGKYW